MKKLLSLSILVSILGLSQTSMAGTQKIYVMMDGSVASCSSREDLSEQAYRLTAVKKDNLALIQIETLVCVKSESTFIWAQRPLSDEKTENTELGLVKHKVTKAFLQITDFDGLTELHKINLNVDKAVQIVSLPESVLKLDRLTLTLQSYHVARLNGQIYDEGYTSSGHFGLKLK